MNLIKKSFEFKLLLVLSLSISWLQTSAQYIQPDPGFVFDDQSIPRIEVTIGQADLDIILEPGNEASDEEYPCNVRFITPVQLENIDGVGFRLRGNTSRWAAKKSFKIAVNSFERGRDFEGLEKLNINGEHNDPSIMRSKISWDLMRDAGAISSRSNHVELYINNEYKGLYIHVEHIDEEFIEERFGNKTGNLYKCLWPADLDYISSNPDAYKFDNNGRRAYELKINEEVDDYSDLAHFIDVLNNTPSGSFESEIEQVFDPYSYMRALAVEVLIGHWDNYGHNMNNYYLYNNPDDGRFYYIPYDLDNTFGIDWFNTGAEWNIYNWFDEGRHPGPLTRRIMEVPKYRDWFTRLVYDLITNYYDPQVIYPRIDGLKSMIEESAERDDYRVYDYGFSISDFHNSYDQVVGDYPHILFGLNEFIEIRYQSALDQLDDFPILGVQKSDQSISIYPNPVHDYLWVNTTIQAEEMKMIIYDLEGQMMESFPFYDTPLKWDNKLETGMYIIQIWGDDTIVRSEKIIIK